MNATATGRRAPLLAYAVIVAAACLVAFSAGAWLFDRATCTAESVDCDLGGPVGFLAAVAVGILAALGCAAHALVQRRRPR